MGEGIIKEYNYNGNLIFEGQYLNGKRNGQGKEYNCYYFEGKFENSERNSKGKEYYPNYILKIIKYEGEFKNDKRNGEGKEYDIIY